jgi:hypothetical protein
VNKKTIDGNLIEITVKETEKTCEDFINYYNNVKKDNPKVNDMEILMKWSCEHIAKINIALHMQRALIQQLVEQLEGDRIGQIPKSMIN